MSDTSSAYYRPSYSYDRELVETDRGTPCGEFMRRYWHPIAVSSNVTTTPQNVRILGEDLILFRDGSGRVGLLTPRCIHRGASLYYGKVDENGIRCCYHGWQFDTEGRCIDQPCEPQGGIHRHKVRQPWYPVQERYGLVFAYMGPPEKKPVLPKWDALENRTDNEIVVATDSSFSVGGDDSIKILPWNWLQDWENSTDPWHVYVLHSSFSGTQFAKELAVRPEITWHYTELGLEYQALRGLPDGRRLKRVSPMLFPSIISTPDVQLAPGRTTTVGWVVPVDNKTHRRFHAMVIPKDFKGRPPQMYVEQRDKAWIDMSEAERQTSPGDWEAQMSQGEITLHEEEHLATSDRGIVMLRRMLRDQIKAVQEGRDPVGVTFDESKALFRTGGGNFFLEAQAAE